mgnify:CR=1 FL=1
MEFIPRSVTENIKSQAFKFPIIAVTGPRQSGKTTLLKAIFPEYTYVSLEDKDLRALAESDPRAFLARFNSRVIFDEVQRVPGLFSYFQTIVDESGEMGQFILSGSQNFHLMEQITQSLAGRVVIFRLLPFDSTELPESIDKNNWQERILNGFYPGIYKRNLRPDVFYASYLQTYIERDVSSLTNVHNLDLFRKLINLCAGRIGQVVNYTSLANECGISQPTARAWLNLLQLSYVIFLLPPYYENFNKRSTKAPKMYFYDVGLAAFLLGLRSGDDLFKTRLRGNLFENLVIADIIKKNHHQYLFKDFYFWKEQSGNEVDLLTVKALDFDIYEIKTTQTILPKLFKGMDKFEKISDDRVRSKTLIYGGSENQNRTHYTIRNWYDVDIK